MKRLMVFSFVLLLSLFASINVVRAADESFADQFLGSPLLILTAFIIIDIVAFVYHKIRK